MKGPLESQVWYRRLQVRINKFGWNLRITPTGGWMLSHPDGGFIIRRVAPKIRQECSLLMREMRIQERQMRRRKKEGPWGGSAKRLSDHSRHGSMPKPWISRPGERWSGDGTPTRVTN